MTIIYLAITIIFYCYLVYKVYLKTLVESIDQLPHKPIILIASAIVIVGTIFTPILFVMEGKQPDLNRQGNPLFEEVNGISIIKIPTESKDKIKIIYE